jgi:hypothetical protein
MSRTSAALRRPPTGDGSSGSSEHRSDRPATLEAKVAAIQQALDVQFARIAQMQAQIDLLVANHGNNSGAEHAERATSKV